MNPVFEGPIALLKFGWQIFAKHWKILTSIVLLPSIFQYVGQVVGYSNSNGVIIVAVILSIAGIILSIAMIPALVNAIHRLSTDNSVSLSLRGQYKFGFSMFWSFVLVLIINGFVGLGSFVLLVIPGIIVAVYTCMYAFTRVLDDKRGFSSLAESYTLVRGRWWPVLGRLLFIGLIMLIGYLILMGIAVLIGTIFNVPAWTQVRDGVQQTMPFGGFITHIVINIIGSVVITPIAVGYLYGLYASLKETRKTDVSVSTFRKWLKAFTVIGVIMLIAIPIIAVSVGISAYKAVREQSEAAGMRYELGTQELQNTEVIGQTIESQ